MRIPLDCRRHSCPMTEDLTQRVFGFTQEEWTRALAFDTTDDDAANQVAEMFARHRETGSDGYVFEHRSLLRLAYVSPDCRARVIAQIAALGSDASWLLEKLRDMDRDARASGVLRHPPASDPL